VPPGRAATATDPAGNLGARRASCSAAALAVDATPGDARTATASSSLESGRRRTFWSNLTGTEVVATGQAGATGPAGPTYALTIATANYSTIGGHCRRLLRHLELLRRFGSSPASPPAPMGFLVR
jgi:hypothetical protein